MKDKFPLIIGAITLILIIGGIFTFSNNSQSSPTPPVATDSYLYFWGEGCPHCKNVADFLETWDGKDKIKLDKREVWYNRDNAKLMQEKSKICNLKQSEMGVPLMITPDGKCLIGDEPIINLLKSL
jgi:thiol-disulfide isomerase/thioredoxin